MYFTSDKPHYPYELPEGWAWCKLEDIAYVASGSTPDKSSFVSNGIPYIKMYNLRNQNIDFKFKPQFIKEDVHNGKLQRSRTEVGDLIMNIVGPPLGKLALIPPSLPQANFNQAAVLIRPYLHKDIINVYLKAYLEEMTEINSISTKGSAGQVNISLTQSQNMRIPLPPVSEQHRIIKELKHWLSMVDCIDCNKEILYDTIKHAKSKILDLAIHGKLVPQYPTDEPASELLKRINPKAEITSDNGHYQKLPEGWCLCLLNDVLKEVFAGGDKPLIFSKNKSEENYIPIYANGTENKGLFGFTNKAQVYERCLTISARGTIGFTCIREVPFVPIVRLITAIPLPVINLLFLKHQIDTMLSYTEGSSIPQLTIPTIKRMPIILPPLKEQFRIVAKIEELFALLDTIKAQL